MQKTQNIETFLCLQHIGSFCGSTENALSDFWWCLPWVSKPGWIPSLACFMTRVDKLFRFISGATPTNLLIIPRGSRVPLTHLLFQGLVTVRLFILSLKYPIISNKMWSESNQAERSNAKMNLVHRNLNMFKRMWFSKSTCRHSFYHVYGRVFKKSPALNRFKFHVFIFTIFRRVLKVTTRAHKSRSTIQTNEDCNIVGHSIHDNQWWCYLLFPFSHFFAWTIAANEKSV